MEGRGVGEDKTTNERVKSSVILFIFAFGDDMRHCRNIFVVIVSEKNEKMKPQMGRLGTAKTEATRIRSIKTNKKKSLPLRESVCIIITQPLHVTHTNTHFLFFNVLSFFIICGERFFVSFLLLLQGTAKIEKPLPPVFGCYKEKNKNKIRLTY